jgi:hypothetical protein
MVIALGIVHGDSRSSGGGEVVVAWGRVDSWDVGCVWWCCEQSAGLEAMRRTEFGRTGFMLDGSVVYRLVCAGQEAPVPPSDAPSAPNAVIFPESPSCDRRSVRRVEADVKGFCNASGRVESVRIDVASGTDRQQAFIERTSMMVIVVDDPEQRLQDDHSSKSIQTAWHTDLPRMQSDRRE